MDAKKAFLTKLTALPFILILLFSSLVACDESNPYDAIVFNRELDFRSVLDKETGAIFSLGDPRSYFEEVFGAGERICFESELEIFEFYRFENNDIMLVELLTVAFSDNKAVEISTSSGRFEFAHISFDTLMDDLPDTFHFFPNFAGNATWAHMYFDSNGNILDHPDTYRLHVWSLGRSSIMQIRLSWLELLYLQE